MRRTTILQQLESDYPGVRIAFDEDRSLLLMDDNKISLLLDREMFERINVHSNSGKNYYQAIVQLIYSQYRISPEKGSYADGLITYREEYQKYRIGNLAKDYGIGFLEDENGEVIAVKIDGDLEKPVMIEEDLDLQERLKIERRKAEEGLDDDFGLLLDVFDE